MKVNFVISKLYNQFHFVENMSEWSEYTRKWKNQSWIATTWPLSAAEKNTLASVKKFFCTYDYDKTVGAFKNIFEFFTVAERLDDYAAELNNLIGERQANIILDAMEVFSKRFEKIWSIQKTNFSDKYPLILDNLHEIEIKQVMKEIFSISKFPAEINAYCVISTKQYASGGANIGKDRITLECSTAVDINDIMTIFWHEVAHLLQVGYAKKVYEIVKKNNIHYDYVSELLAHSVFGTYGVLAHKYYHAPYMDRGMAKMESYLITGKIPEEDRHLTKLMPFMASQYYAAKFVEEKFFAGDSIAPKEMAATILEIHEKTKNK